MFFASIILAALAVAGCTKDGNPYEGTTWTKSEHSYYSGKDYTYVLQLGDGEATFYTGDANGSYKENLSKGTYTYDGDRITFEGLTNGAAILTRHFSIATVSGSTMSLDYWWAHADGEKEFETMALMKK